MNKTEPISREYVSSLSIDYELTQLYSDYIHSLFMLVSETYLGDDVTPFEQRVNHFKWCWKTNIQNFEEEGIHFEDTDESYLYFLDMLIAIFYSADKTEYKQLVITIRIIWITIFNYENHKTNLEKQSFIKIYNLLSRSLQKEKILQKP
tara:strand:+ start:85 stop:531 length:447 start_codon:yes stop_codon:yes gene_type:complete